MTQSYSDCVFFVPCPTIHKPHFPEHHHSGPAAVYYSDRWESETHREMLDFCQALSVIPVAKQKSGFWWGGVVLVVVGRRGGLDSRFSL